MMSKSLEYQQTHSKDEIIMLLIFVDWDYGIPRGFEIDVLSSCHAWRSVDFRTKMNIKQVIVIIHTNAGPKLLTLLPFLCHELYSGNVCQSQWVLDGVHHSVIVQSKGFVFYSFLMLWVSGHDSLRYDLQFIWSWMKRSEALSKQTISCDVMLPCTS